MTVMTSSKAKFIQTFLFKLLTLVYALFILFDFQVGPSGTGLFYIFLQGSSWPFPKGFPKGGLGIFMDSKQAIAGSDAED